MRWTFLIALLVLILLLGCAKPPLEKTTHVETPMPIQEEPETTECCIGCGVNECFKPECPFECCIDAGYQLKECPKGECQNNICVITERPSTYLYVYPDKVYAGEYIYITLSSGDEGASEKLDFYGPDGERIVSYYARCKGEAYNCYQRVRVPYKTPADWKHGNYYVTTLDLETKEYVRADFAIKARPSIIGFIVKIWDVFTA